MADDLFRDAPIDRQVVVRVARSDETYVKVASRWRYVYRAIDQFGQVVDVFVSACRDAKAAHRVFRQTLGTTRAAPQRSRIRPGTDVSGGAGGAAASGVASYRAVTDWLAAI
jgi:hypothetical protein